MSRTHDVTISAFDLDRIEAELAAVTEQRDRLADQIEANHKGTFMLERMVYQLREQRDRLAEALKDVMKYRKGEEPYDYWRLPESHRRNVQFDGWNEIENRINEALAAVKGGQP
jgi:septal ring factor EnvC (AmiA/AmiB activator)